MKYKLIKKIPYFWDRDKIRETDKFDLIISDNNDKVFVRPSEWPEFFEEVKDPLFVTEDGVNVLDKDQTLYGVCPTGAWDTWRQQYKYIGGTGRVNNKWFSTLEARDKYIDENKPRYSKKEINAVIKNGICLHADNLACFVDNLRSKLNLYEK
jgi:hypothetical protein